MMQKVFCFGELLLRYSPASNSQWIPDAGMPVFIGGAELNVATALTNWLVPVKYGTALPDHALSKEIVQELHQKNIDVSAILFQGNRVGTYYLPQGADLKKGDLIYDRAGSSFGDLKPGMIDWNAALADCGWFHFSAISPALSDDVAAVCKEALQAASAKGLTISVDLNYRARLWQYNKLPTEVMPDLVRHCHIIMGNIWAAETLLGIESGIKDSEGKSKEELIDATRKNMAQVSLQYPTATTFAYTFRMQNDYWAVLQHGPETVISKQFLIGDVIDKAGSGDCFMGGLIYGLYNKHSPQQIINYAASAAVGKLQEKGDATRQTIEQVNARLK